MDPERDSFPPTTDVRDTGPKPIVRLPADLLDRLLVALSEVEPGQSVEDALGLVLSAAFAALPRMSFGARVPDGCAENQVLVIRKSAELISAEPPLEGPIFPELPFESQFPIEHEPSGIFAIAVRRDSEDLPDRTTMYALTSRLSMVLGSALRVARQVPRSNSIPPPTDGRRRAVHNDKLAGLGRVVAGVVHELNNPVTSILAYAEYLKRKAEKGPLGPADIERIVRIEEAAQRIFGFSRELMAYARPSSDAPAELVLHDVINRALLFCEHVLERAQIKVERKFGEIKPVRGHSGQLAQVFVNLFTNAANAMNDGGGALLIETGLTDGDKTVRVTVTDTGKGIEEHALPRLFEPFFTASADGGGTGLGLSIVRDIVESHQGRVWAERRKGGAVFHVALPATLDD